MEGRAAEMVAATQAGGIFRCPPLGVGRFSKPRPLRRGLENQANEERGAKNYR